MEHSDISSDIEDDFEDDHEHWQKVKEHFLEMISFDIFKMIHTSPYSYFA